MLVNEHLMRALLYAGLFFATCTEEQCDLEQLHAKVGVKSRVELIRLAASLSLTI